MTLWYLKRKLLVPVVTRQQQYTILSNVQQKPQNYDLSHACYIAGIYDDERRSLFLDSLYVDGLLYINKETLLTKVTKKGRDFIKNFEDSENRYLKW